MALFEASMAFRVNQGTSLVDGAAVLCFSVVVMLLKPV
jgi:hypothetical protein